MARDPDIDVETIPDPREQTRLFGHEAAERALLDGLASGRLHHAWLIGGAEGIGKATLAYRFARFLLAKGDPRAPDLSVAPDHPAHRQIAAMSNPNLMVLQVPPREGEKATPRTISVEAVRRTMSFFGSTAADSGYRICIVDSAEDLTPASANALLKIIEEPPTRSLFLIVSHVPDRVLATVRSRCRKLMLRPLSGGDIRSVIRSYGDPWTELEEDRLQAAIDLSQGSVRRTLAFLDPDTIRLVGEVAGLLDALPAPPMKRILALADQLANRQGEEAFRLALEAVYRWLSARVHRDLDRGPARLAPLAELCEKVGASARLVDTYNLDRRPFVVSLFSDLAEAVRRAT